MTDINRELAEDAAEEYASEANGGLIGAAEFANGWYAYCCGQRLNLTNIGQPCVADIHWINGYIAARDAPE